MALSTVLIGILPTYNIGAYKAGIASSILLALLRLVQGLAMGGEFGSAGALVALHHACGG
jgi:MFS family permease